MSQQVYPPRGRSTTVYEVRDAAGKLVAEHHRFETADGKKCLWKLPNTGPEDWGLKGRKLESFPLYGSERLADWPEDRPVVVVEGEKAAQALLDAGIPALGTVTGAGLTPSADVLEFLRGRELILWADTDEPGRKHMERVAEQLQGIAALVRVFTWHDAPVVMVDGKPKGQDAADHPAVIGGSEKALGILLNDLLGAPLWEPPKAAPRGLRGRVKLGERIAGGIQPPEQLVEGLLYRGRLHAINAEPGEGKTITALYAAREVIRKGLPVLCFDAENGPGPIAERLADMGATPEELDEFLHYYSSPEISLGADALEDLRATVEEVRPALVVFDSLADYLALAGLEENAAGDVTRWILAVAQPLKEAGAAVLLLDHVAKSADNRGRYARGSGAKLAKCDVVWSLSQTLPFDRERVGEIRLTLRKDREAFMPRRATFAVGGTPDGLMFKRADGVNETADPSDGLTESQRIALEALRRVAGEEGATYSQWRAEANLADTTFDRARDGLVKAGLVMRAGQRYHAINPEPPLYPHGGGAGAGGAGVGDNPHGGGGGESGFSEPNPPTPTNPHTTPTGVSGGGAKTATPNNPRAPYRGGGSGGKAGGAVVELSVEEVGAELRRADSGPARALKHYLAEPSRGRLEQLARAVLYVVGRDPATWYSVAGVVEEAAADPAYHPLNCECSECM